MRAVELGYAALAITDRNSLAGIVRAHVAAKGAGPLKNLMASTGGSPQSMEAFEIGGGALPHYKLYGKSGALRQEFGLDPMAEKQFTPADIEAAVTKLLDE